MTEERNTTIEQALEEVENLLNTEKSLHADEQDADYIDKLENRASQLRRMLNGANKPITTEERKFWLRNSPKSFKDFFD